MRQPRLSKIGAKQRTCLEARFNSEVYQQRRGNRTVWTRFAPYRAELPANCHT